MIKEIVFAIFILRVHFAYAQFIDEAIPSSPIACGSSNARPSDPVPAFLSGLGDLIVDIDKEFSRQLTRKARVESDTKDKMYGRPGPGYFSRIREIYRTFQRRFGTQQDLHTASGIEPISVQHKEPRSEDAAPLHFLKLAVSSDEGLGTSDDDDTESGHMEPGQNLPRYKRNFKLGSTEINMNSNLDPLQTSELLKKAENQIKRILESVRLPEDNIGDHQSDENMKEKKLNNRQNLESELNLVIEEISPAAIQDSQISEATQFDYSDPEDPIPEDDLYSEDSSITLAKRRGLRFKHWLGRVFSIKFQINFRID